jgi:molybdate transport system substrate-binding protein
VRAGLVLCALLVGLSSCGDDRDELHLLAAASLTDVAAQLEEAYEATHPDVDVVVNVAGSNALVQLINGGAAVDVFLPANRAVLTQLDANYTDAGTVARNQLTIAVPAGNPAGIAQLEDLTDSNLLIAICAEGVPCGDATALLPVVIQADTKETNVRAVAAKVAAGEVDAGIVYASDVAALAAIEEVAIGPERAVTVEIPLILLSPDDRGFVELLTSAEGQLTFRSNGFLAP